MSAKTEEEEEDDEEEEEEEEKVCRKRRETDGESPPPPFPSFPPLRTDTLTHVHVVFHFPLSISLWCLMSDAMSIL